MICKFCNIEKNLIKAHIIAEVFFRDLRDSQGHLTIHSKVRGEYPKKSPIGIYDKNILCESCEKLFEKWDYYGQMLLLKEQEAHEPFYHQNKILCYKIKDYTYNCLKLFFVSILWRAAVSKHPFYSEVTLRPYVAKAREMLRTSSAGQFSDFAVVLSKFDGTLGKTILEPHRIKLDGINYINFYLSGYNALIKTDRRLGPESLNNFFLKPDSPLIILAREFKNSKEFEAIMSIKKAGIN